MELSIDLNSDLGEGAGHDRELLGLVSSANIACGLHAGDPDLMREAILSAKERNVAIGAHPGFHDRESFGRREISLPSHEIFSLVVYQLGAFQALAHSLGMRPRHVKPHGALYNMAAREEEIAEAIVRAVMAVDRKLILFAPTNTELSRAAENHELQYAREVFADRNYMPDGSLVPRDHRQALLHDPVEAANRVYGMLRDNKVRAIDGSTLRVEADTICVHGDTPGAVEFARELRLALHQMGIVVAPPGDAR
ncbi:MAG TPA: 5-oxoprolinase subunit PxpA [Chthoniobacterales bacterium]|nr:5-oxoprolinase subunit PxpA [Chthoniobacterales bacterium]